MTLAEVKIGNLKTTKEGIKCDRSSVLGNPFFLSSEWLRDRVVKAYREYLHLVVNTWDEPEYAALAIAERDKLFLNRQRWKSPTRAELVDELVRIERLIITEPEVTLLCWCAPKACHCDVLKNYFAWSLNFTQKNNATS